MVFLPELTVMAAGLVFFGLSLTASKPEVVRNTAYVFYAILSLVCLGTLHSSGELFYGAFRVDMFSQLSKLAIAVAAFIVVVICGGHEGIKEKFFPEYQLFQAVSVLGLMMLVSSVDLLAIFVALELSSFAVYVMVPIRRDNEGKMVIQLEAGIKYLLFGVVATGFMLFGMSYIYGLAGSTNIAVIAERLPDLLHEPALVIAAVMVMAGFFFKLAFFPFHFWVPDVYEGASNETTAFIAAAPKIAAVALLVRLASLFDIRGESIGIILAACAVLSMFYGNLSALVQKDIKRMLAFSGIAHAGFVMLGVLTFQTIGYASAAYYIFGYMLMILACFMVICCISKNGDNVAISDFTGLYQRSPLLAVTLLIALFSLAGIPPFIGFTGKFMLLVGAFKEGHHVLVTLAAINTAIGIYYYLSVVRLTFCTADESQESLVINKPNRFMQAISLVLIVAIIYFGVLPNHFLNLMQTALSGV
ncbi:MAG: NADH-quinone oxidoreductase subunit N [Desulfobulbaceae bacterium]|jgi:NADH-quinone oxidoreductase subunit N|nr:NADH-quinone oxidoreductase subunit N [Desulfobulbaceae bacterium]